MTHDSSGAPGQAEALPDLTALDLRALRALDHPVLSEVLDGLRERAGSSSEMLWGFNNAM
ncbi:MULTISPECIES: FxSxx-COOH cyclophane-containing RiPP peptide [unclassified Streptomyces]|uniref:FxSxx-COOH cyclophane-containing RiPP peptide n=2 Tax=Streptomyces TaxID=1883 RepID=A0ABU2R9G6_9ACTN|nr:MULTISPECIES: FxSxx-COOH cyclophane-containing RiPP peptide [unclassified Streptomyces]ASY32803.1 FXSXX-COOH protein [Streptomyces sp. CLI2509]MDT0413348.1 FxSxx-COOH cyclophane-containing RiPP peptide [Streptomyces sp. DSM 41979]MDT0424600.1 FxSxx-COOH cyclophane-containing RiPP peptide [Streptomyces sp. DSM 41859]MYQ61901.1 FXSXX-COOH protein [Streptomyces sp. SID4926]MYR30217.1 FXSXX-COOH protein [Streptomyces sp. SID4945]